MKPLVKILFVFLLSLPMGRAAFAQNLVSNPSFEDTLSCPCSLGEIDKAVSWSSYGYSPDYFNSCSNPCASGIPKNAYGYQNPATGNSYVGLVTYGKGAPFPGFREMIGAELISPLETGEKYFITFKVSFALSQPAPTGLASDKIGVRFSNVAYNDTSQPIFNAAHLYTNQIILDTINWTTISGMFVPDSSYQYIMLGNFFDDDNTDTVDFNINGQNEAYYYIDDICVSKDSLLCSNIASASLTRKEKTECVNIQYTDNINVSINTNCQVDFRSYRLFDLSGRIVKYGSLSKGNNVKWRANDIPNGIFLLQLYSSDFEVYSTKLLNQNNY